MHNKIPRLSEAQSGSGEPHSAQRSFPGILLRILATESCPSSLIISPELLFASADLKPREALFLVVSALRFGCRKQI